MSSESTPSETPPIEAQVLEAFGTADDLAVALGHLQEMRSSGDFCCIDLNSDYAYVWSIQYAWSEQRPHVEGHLLRLGTEVPEENLSVAIEEFYTRWKAEGLATGL